jgi:hypothetical protein
LLLHLLCECPRHCISDPDRLFIGIALHRETPGVGPLAGTIVIFTYCNVKKLAG